MRSCTGCGATVDAGTKFCPECGTRLVESGETQDALLGRTLNDKYRLLEKIGSGSMGAVYLAQHIALNKRVALKILRPDVEVTSETLQRFQREGIAAGSFNHPNAIQIFDFDRAGENLFYLAMEFVEGETLTELMRRQGAIPLRVALGITRQVLGVLAAAHDEGIVHRDLKPDNIMVVPAGNGELSVKVLDFGLSRLVHLPLGASLATQPGRIMGTPRYMAPEQGSGKAVDHRSDLYAVGLILYEMLAGEPPFEAESVRDLLVKQATETPASLREAHPELPEALDELVDTALEKSRADRFQSAGEMLRALDDIEHELDGGAPAAPRRAKRRTTRRPARAKQGAREPGGSGTRPWIPVAVGVVVVAAAVAGWQLIGSGVAGAAPAVRVSMKDAADRTEVEGRYVALLEEATIHLASGDTDLALAKVEKAQLLPCKDSEVYLVRAQVYRERDDDETALVDFREALRLDPGYAAAMVGQGWIELDRGSLAAAKQSFDRAVESGGGGPALAGQGAVAFLQDDPAKAEELLREACAADPESAAAHFWLGRTLSARGELDGALDEFIQAKRQAPRDWRTLAALGETYLAQDRPADAEKQFQEALSRNPDAIEAIDGLASLLVGGERFREAGDLLETSVQRHPREGRLLVLQAAVLDAEGERAKAIEVLERALLSDAADARVHTLLGILYQQDGQLDRALARYDRAIELDPDAFLAHKNRGLALFALERFADAEAALQRALLLVEDDAFVHYALGLLYMDYLSRPDDAVQHFRAYRECGGQDARVAGWLRKLEQ